MVVVALIFMLRLFQLQILEGADLANRSQRNSVRTLRIEAPRGDIVDREGRVLATTRPAFRVQVIPNELQGRERTYGVLGELLEVDSAVLQKKVEFASDERVVVLVSGGNVDLETIARIFA